MFPIRTGSMRNTDKGPDPVFLKMADQDPYPDSGQNIDQVSEGKKEKIFSISSCKTSLRPFPS
jgi:hypothetical protein